MRIFAAKYLSWFWLRLEAALWLTPCIRPGAIGWRVYCLLRLLYQKISGSGTCRSSHLPSSGSININPWQKKIISCYNPACVSSPTSTSTPTTPAQRARTCRPRASGRWAQLKGISVIGTGDFTHPGWLKELEEKLEPAGNGLFMLKKEYPDRTTFPIPARPMSHFILSAEISCIYSKNGKTRKVHSVILAPDFAAAERLNSCALEDRQPQIRRQADPGA